MKSVIDDPTARRQVIRGGGGRSRWTIESEAIPTLGSTEVMIRVEAAALNQVDLLMLRGEYNSNRTDASYTAGRECAGQVLAIGSEVTSFTIGDPVMAAVAGAFATHVNVDQNQLMPAPSNLSWVEIAALPVGLRTEHDALVTQAGMSVGDSVVILGGSTSVGLIGLAMARALGAGHIIASTTDLRKAPALRKAGADEIVDTNDETFPQQILSATSGVGASIVLDHLGGRPLAKTIGSVAVGGTVVNIGRLAGTEATIDLNDLSFRRIRLQGTTFSGRDSSERADVSRALRSRVLPAVFRGDILMPIDRVFPFDRAVDAVDYLKGTNRLGKVVLSIL